MIPWTLHDLNILLFACAGAEADCRQTGAAGWRIAMTGDIYQPIPAPGLWADLILVVHALIVCFVIVGQLLILAGWWRGWAWVRNAWFRLAHLATIVVVALQAWLGRLCPLTIWERELRRAAGQAYHEQSFIEYWVARYLYLDLPWWVFVAAYTLFAALVASTWWRLPPRPSGRSGRQS